MKLVVELHSLSHLHPQRHVCDHRQGHGGTASTACLFHAAGFSKDHHSGTPGVSKESLLTWDRPAWVTATLGSMAQTLQGQAVQHALQMESRDKRMKREEEPPGPRLQP